MLMPMVWTNGVDEMMDDFFDPYDPFEVVPVVDVEPSKDEIEAAKSVERHARKEGRRYARARRSSWNEMNRDLQKLAMKTDVVDNGDHFTITADLPGFDKKDISIALSDGVLTVSAHHEGNEDRKDEKTGKYLRRERTEASYERSFEVGREVKPEEITAKYENGVLSLNVPNKTAAAKKDETRKIEIH